jgi:cyclic-di-GMP-binding biofilm dispersal mediator protein
MENTNLTTSSVQDRMKVIAVIGATGEIGRRFVEQLLALEDPMLEVVSMVRDKTKVSMSHAGTKIYEIDITKRETLENAFLEISKTQGELLGVINAAGVVAFGESGSLPEGVVSQLVGVNTLGVLNILGAALKYVSQGGWVLNMSGVAAEMPVMGMGAYCSSKAGASMAMKVANRELKRRGARAIDVRVGHTETGLAGRALYGEPLKMSQGLDPDYVVSEILKHVKNGETDIGPDRFLRTS